jgi:uncharacterized membrane protein
MNPTPMISRGNRKIILGIGIFVLFALLIVSITMYLSLLHQEREDTRLSHNQIDNMTKQEIKDFLDQRMDAQYVYHSYYLLPFVAFISLLIGTLVFYIMSDKVIQQDQSLKRNANIILDFLTSPERKVIETLLEKGGQANQYELSRLPGLNKLRTHRILSNLEQKGIIQKERIGKINRIVLKKELYEVLK